MHLGLSGTVNYCSCQPPLPSCPLGPEPKVASPGWLPSSFRRGGLHQGEGGLSAPPSPGSLLRCPPTPAKSMASHSQTLQSPACLQGKVPPPLGGTQATGTAVSGCKGRAPCRLPGPTLAFRVLGSGPGKVTSVPCLCPHLLNGDNKNTYLVGLLRGSLMTEDIPPCPGGRLCPWPDFPQEDQVLRLKEHRGHGPDRYRDSQTYNIYLIKYCFASNVLFELEKYGCTLIPQSFKVDLGKQKPFSQWCNHTGIWLVIPPPP